MKNHLGGYCLFSAMIFFLNAMTFEWKMLDFIFLGLNIFGTERPSSLKIFSMAFTVEAFTYECIEYKEKFRKLKNKKIIFTSETVFFFRCNFNYHISSLLVYFMVSTFIIFVHFTKDFEN